MVRTKDHSGVKVAGAKASRKIQPPIAKQLVKLNTDKNRSNGGNLVCPRETPAWQKPITDFFESVRETSANKSTGQQETLGECSGTSSWAGWKTVDESATSFCEKNQLNDGNNEMKPGDVDDQPGDEDSPENETSMISEDDDTQ